MSDKPIFAEDIVRSIQEGLDKESKRINDFYKNMGEDCGYTGNPCPNCGRNRVIHWSSGKDICEKCSWCAQLNGYALDYDGNLFYDT